MYKIFYCPFYVVGKDIKDYTTRSNKITLKSGSVILVLKEDSLAFSKNYTLAIYNKTNIVIPHICISQLITRQKEYGLYLGPCNSKLARLFYL